jgi:hypothetical protein
VQVLVLVSEKQKIKLGDSKSGTTCATFGAIESFKIMSGSTGIKQIV